MTNLEELKEAESNLRKILEPIDRIGIESASLLTMVVSSTYLSSIAKSLAIIADKMSENDKEEVNVCESYNTLKRAKENPVKTNRDKFKESFGFDFKTTFTASPWTLEWLDEEYKEPKDD